MLDQLDSAIDRYVPMKKQGKWSKKKHLSNEAFRKIRYKHPMWRVYKHTGKDTDYKIYKQALNEATNERRKSKQNFEHKLAQNIKSDSNSFYAYVRNKQNVREFGRGIKYALKPKIYAISSDTHQLQCIKLHHFKLERF